MDARVELIEIQTCTHSHFLTVHIVNCTVPAEPCNGAIVDYERLNETVLEETLLTYQCDNGLSLTGPNTITCTNTGVWSTEPEEIKCVLMTEGDEFCNCLLSIYIYYPISQFLLLLLCSPLLQQSLSVWLSLSL